MASFNASINHSFYQKQIIDKAFQNLLEESMMFEHPSIMRKFHDTSTLNLSSVRADLFRSMKSKTNPGKWRNDLKEKCKMAEKLSHSWMLPNSSWLSTNQTHIRNHAKRIDEEFVTAKVASNIEKKSPKKRPRSSCRSTSEMMPSLTAETQLKNSKRRRMEENPLQNTGRLAFNKSYRSSQGSGQPTVSNIKEDKRTETTVKKNDYVFDQWIFRFDENDNIFIKGHLSGSPPSVFWSTSEIVKRIDSKTLLTASGKLCILDGPLLKKAMVSKGYSETLIKQFLNGFPPRWEEILKARKAPASVTQWKRPQTEDEVIEKRPHRIMKYNEIIEEEKDEGEEDTGNETDESEEINIIPIRQKRNRIPKNFGDAYLFDVLSHDAKQKSNPKPKTKSRSRSRSQSRSRSRKISKQEGSPEVGSVPSNQIKTRSMARLENRKVQHEPTTSAPVPELKLEKCKATLGEPVLLKNVKKEVLKSPVAKTHAPKKTQVKKKSSSRKSTQREQCEVPQTVLKDKKFKVSQTAKVQKPSHGKKNTEEKKEPLKKTVSKKGARSKEKKKRKEEWTEEEVHKLLNTVNTVPKSDIDFWKKVAAKVGRSAKECADYYCHCDISNFNWKSLGKKDKKEEFPKSTKRVPRIYDLSDSYDDMFDLDNFIGKKTKIHLRPEDGNLDSVFSDLSVKTPSSLSDPAFQTPLAKFFLTPVSECQTPASTFSDGDIKIDWDNADRCVKRFKNKQKKGAGRLQILQKNARFKTEMKPKNLQLESLVGELNKMNEIPTKSDEADESNLYFSSDTED